MSLYRQGKVPGSFYDGFGQEAVSAGAAFAMAPEDRLCILHRDLAAHLVRGRHPGADPRPVHGPRGRHHRRPRRQRPLRRPPPRLRRDGLDAARHDARRHRHGDGVQAARRAALRDHLVRRRLDLARRLPRGDELGRRAAAAGDLRAREQPVRLLDPAGQAVRGRPGRARRRLRVRRRDRRRQRRRGDVRGHPRRARARAGGRRPDADRGGDDADARPRRPRRHEVRAQGAGRGVAQRATRSTGRTSAAARARRRRRRAARARSPPRSTPPPRRRWRRRCPTRRRPSRASSARARPSRSATGRRRGAVSPARGVPDADAHLPAGDLDGAARRDARRRARARDGRGHRRVRRRLQGHRRLLRRVRRRPRDGHAAGRVGDHRHRGRRRRRRHAPGLRDAVLRLHLLRLRPAGQRRRARCTTARGWRCRSPSACPRAAASPAARSTRRTPRRGSCTRPGSRWSPRRPPRTPRACCTRRSATPTRCASWSTSTSTGGSRARCPRACTRRR